MGVLMMLKSVIVLAARQVKKATTVIPGRNDDSVDKTEKNVKIHNYNETNSVAKLGTPVK